MAPDPIREVLNQRILLMQMNLDWGVSVKRPSIGKKQQKKLCRPLSDMRH